MTTRALILNDAAACDTAFLVAAASLCRRMGAAPVILTLARTEHAAHEAERMARDSLGAEQADVLFDCLIGLRMRTAVGRIAHWRRCQLVVLNKPRERPWWRRLQQPSLKELASWFPNLNLLYLSACSATDTANGADDNHSSTQPGDGELADLKRTSSR